MLGFLKNLLRKPHGAPPESEQAAAHESLPAATPTPAPHYNLGTQASAPRRNGVTQNGKGVEIPLQSILQGLPLELQPRIAQSEVGDRTICVPLAKVLAQLSRGVVKVSFGELRQAAPDVFSLENDRDRVLVPLPLSEILGRLNPALITRRRVQRQIQVPEEISSPFDGQCQSVEFASGSAQQAEAPQLPPARQNLPSPSIQAPPPSPMAPAMPAQHAAPSPVPVSRAGFSAPPSPPMAPAAPITPMASPAETQPRFTVAPPTPPSLTPSVPAPMVPSAPIPFSRAPLSAASAPAVPFASAAAQPARETSPRPVHAPVSPGAPQPGKAANGSEPLLVGLTALAEGWPEGIRK
ncbi:MAG TPA: hypothetical protein VHI52_01150, partial [Verrucomicrobiae bacterium]|nr:hypothetical protein [Verrucomicrobiae bacterium]